VNVNSHELAHQWFGNYISHLKTKDVWLTESFATYFAKKFEQHIYGEDYYQNIRVQELEDTYTAAKRNNYGVGHAWGGRERFYPKGSLVMDMLRDVLGENEFKTSIKYYLENHPYETAETKDFLQAIRKTTGQSLEWFFEEWIYRGGEPFYEVDYETLTPENGIPEVRIKVDQIHETNALIGLFKMPVNFEIYYKDGSVDQKTQWISDKHQIVKFSNPNKKEIDFVIFDPNRKIIKKVKFDRTYPELVAQAQKAENMIDRYDALMALRDMQNAEKESDLLRIYENESFHLTKSEILAQLAGSVNPEVEKLMGSAIHNSDDKVRLAVLQNLTLIPESLRTEYESLLTDSSYINLALALENLCNPFPENCPDYLERTRNETGWRGLNIRIKWLELSINNGFENNLQELINYSGPSYEFETRINAMDALKRLNQMNPEIAQNMLDGLLHWNYKIRNAARDNLLDFKKQTHWAELIKYEIIKGKWTDNQKLQFFQTIGLI
jgi:aminopeptidase N